MAADEDCDVIICGCGPTGAMLSGYLSRARVKHIIIEKEDGITTDPRGIALDEDGIRLVQGLGLYDKLYTEIGQGIGYIYFIPGGGDLSAPPFMKFNHNTIEGGTSHLGFMTQKQPVLEKYLRSAIDPTYGDLRAGSTVTQIREDDGAVYVTYVDKRGEEHEISAKFLVGADGKTGFTRKKYLEPRGIWLERSDNFRYEAIWVAMNWKLSLPTPATHPDFPLWQLGYSPEDVFGLFFPVNFRFICDPDRPSVCGRFGLPEDRLWRFEFVVNEGEDPQAMSAWEMTKKVVFPFLTHPGHRYGLSEDVQFPEDCIEVLRCRPFNFSARSCNRWALKRVILCGDAAHVFPPFGGQGIVSGFRDAVSLAWRLAIACRPGNDTHQQQLFEGWYMERKQQLEKSLAATVENGQAVTERDWLKVFFRKWHLWALQLVPSWKHQLEMGARREGMTRYQWQASMPFVAALGGGVNFPQVFCAPIDGEAPVVPAFTDDTIFHAKKKKLFQVVVLLSSVDEVPDAKSELEGIDRISKSELDATEATFIIHEQSPFKAAVADSSSSNTNIVRVIGAEEYSAVPKSRIRPAPLYYDADRIRKDFPGKRYIILRSDRFVFAACADKTELATAAATIWSSLEG
ncbi:MAG: hypothetical protein M1834_002965 [Cirrosporium novae-zelandiae]|nr:MAG: hypothetical protein M1834_002965 [Cirrosporium novae-zelandiae]